MSELIRWQDKDLSEYYNADEVDAVLAEKDKEIKRHKYKRCLTMTKLCAKNVDHLNSEGYIYEKENRVNETSDCIKGTIFYHKWYKRWLELAEKFKELK